MYNIYIFVYIYNCLLYRLLLDELPVLDHVVDPQLEAATVGLGQGQAGRTGQLRQDDIKIGLYRISGLLKSGIRPDIQFHLPDIRRPNIGQTSIR